MSSFERPDLASALDDARTGKAWQDFADAVRAAGSVVFDDPRVDSDRLRAEGIRYLMRVLNVTTVVGMEVMDPAYPRLLRLYDTYRNMANINPDCVYLYARLSPEYDYRISGKRGSALMFEIATMDEDMLAYPKGKWLKTISDFEVDADGNIDIVLSATPHDGNWVPLDPDARWMYLRQYYYDWNSEDPADVTIERIGATYPAPAPDPAQTAALAKQVIDWIPAWYRGLSNNLAGRFYASAPGRIEFSPAAGGFEGISYGRGHFTCAADEAIVIEFEPPENTLYWSVHLGTHYWESLDWDLRQCSLNGHQARLDADGRFRGVIAQDDPGYANWLDPAGHIKGLICCRIVRGKWIPEVTMKTVKLADLADHLHPETLRISAEERSAVIRWRMLGVQRRHRE